MAFEVGGQKGRGPRPQMNVTPLVDVVLVLLIIFMVVAPLLVKQFHLLLPPQEKSDTPPPPQTPDDTQIVLSLRADGTIRINQEVVEQPALHDRLQRMFAARTDDIVFFDAQALANYGQAVALMDVARGAGALTVAVLTADPSAPAEPGAAAPAEPGAAAPAEPRTPASTPH